jgi:hypothetical protein
MGWTRLSDGAQDPLFAHRRLAAVGREVALGRHSRSAPDRRRTAKALVSGISTGRVSLGELVSLARRSITVASLGASRMRRLLEMWGSEPEQARSRFDGERCFAWATQRCRSTPGRARALYPTASTSETPGVFGSSHARGESVAASPIHNSARGSRLVLVSNLVAGAKAGLSSCWSSSS